MMGFSTRWISLGAMRVAGVIALAGIAIGVHAQAAPTQPTVITLTQTGCQFVEVEKRDYEFMPVSATDCKTVNTNTAQQRLAHAKTLELQAGTYIFRVTNRDVPYELGFYLRGAGLGRLTLPKIAGGGLFTGTTKDYEIHLEAGEYVYSCPLNPTPNYRLVVKQ